VKTFKLLGTANLGRAIVEDTFGREKFGDDFATALIPNFFKPAMTRCLFCSEVESGWAWDGMGSTS